MKTTGLCAVLLWFATVCPCAAQMMSASQYGEYMRKLDDDATRWQKQLNSVDVEKMKVEYSEGKIIEQGRTEALENLKLLHSFVGRTYKLELLGDDIVIENTLSDMPLILSVLMEHLPSNEEGFIG